MLTNYIHKAMHKATYDLLEDGTFYGEIEGLAVQNNINCLATLKLSPTKKPMLY